MLDFILGTCGFLGFVCSYGCHCLNYVLVLYWWVRDLVWLVLFGVAGY